MKRILKIGVLLSLSLLVFSGVCSCEQTTEGMIAQEEYDALKAQLDLAEAKIAELESKPVVVPDTGQGDPLLEDEIASLKVTIDELGSEIAALDEQNDALAQERAALEAQYDTLNVEYDQLQAALAALSQPEVITEELVEEEIMRLINEERVRAGENRFLTGVQLYKQARRNSAKMAESGQVEVISTTFYQEVFWAAGYESVETIARGALLTWKFGSYRFENNALLSYNKYGSVGAYKSGDIVFITFVASPYP